MEYKGETTGASVGVCGSQEVDSTEGVEAMLASEGVEAILGLEDEDGGEDGGENGGELERNSFLARTGDSRLTEVREDDLQTLRVVWSSTWGWTKSSNVWTSSSTWT